MKGLDKHANKYKVTKEKEPKPSGGIHYTANQTSTTAGDDIKLNFKNKYATET